MLARLIKRLKPKELHDPFFGKLLFMRIKPPGRSYWEGKGVFEPLGKQIEYFIDADESGPAEPQRELYREISRRFPRVYLSVEPILRREFEAAIGTPAPPDLSEVFFLDSISIPHAQSEEMEWEMDFSCSDGDDWLFTVHLRGWTPTGEVSVMH